MSNDRLENLLADKETPPWLQAVPEEEDSTAHKRGFLSGRKSTAMLAGGAVILVTLFLAVILYLYNSPDPNAPVKHVAAPESAIKVKPIDSGGMAIPHQDKQVFDQAAGIEVEKQHQLGPQPETPMKNLPSDEENTLEGLNGDETVIEDSANTKQQAPKPESNPKKAPATDPTNEPVYRVQLGAYGSEKSAERAWRGVQGRFASLVTGLGPEYEAVQAGDRTLYRLRLTPLEDRASAATLCVALRAQDQACIVVKP